MAYCAWKMYAQVRKYYEVLYFSSVYDVAFHTISLLKRMLRHLEWYEGEWEPASDSEGNLWCRTRDGREFKVIPWGFLKASRTLHPNMVIVDDPLQDFPELDISHAVSKTSRLFFGTIVPLAMEETHVGGTSQSPDDFFWETRNFGEWNWKMYPIVDSEGKPNWPELWPKERIKKEREKVGDTRFKVEYLLIPYALEDSYLDYDLIRKAINKKLKNYEFQEELPAFDTTIGGLDLGKVRHPSHLAIFGVNFEPFKLVQIHSKWFDKADYRTILEYCKEAEKAFGVELLFYDDTRSVFEPYKEDGELPACMEDGGVNMSKRTNSLASALRRVFEQNKIELIYDERQIEQLRVVNRSLKAPVTKGGHGESFWSLALAVEACNHIVSVGEKSQLLVL